MKNISNLEIDADKCTKCSTCGKASWHIFECDCGHIVCDNCSLDKAENDEDCIPITCTVCGKGILLV